MKRIWIASSIGIATALVAVATLTASTPATLKTTELGHGPTIVFLHGLGGGRLQWMPVARKLLATNRVVLVDLPGHGESTMPDPFSFNACADAVAELVGRQNPDSTIVVGQGVGGMIAIKTLAAHPGIARGVFAIDAGLKLPQAIPDQQQQYFLQMLDTNYEAIMRPMFVMQGRDSAQGVAMWASASQVDHVVMKTYMAALLPADESKTFHDLKCRFTFVGTSKVWDANKSWPELGKALGYDEPAAIEAHRLGSAGAMIATDQPDSLAMLLRGFQAEALAKK